MDEEDPDTPWTHKDFMKSVEPRWWMRDRYGWPVELVEGHTFRNFLRILFCNLRKVI